ncbi:thiol-disulfide isomerase/thioredoxin [Luteimonas cucumeris]|uniref:Thiol-disulfide isomerase/thioredoxin n=1 Tax=Luteimonas cucumeris TaxID=985012 RepID=A0A562L056_9GAMM|nr:TlpA disulfide reductase family protein [Luteimonas cucumeris]TWI00864.1 thiol-disulfide isomerase/thioredoxin [Luteimonas cucumeris]
MTANKLSFLLIAALLAACARPSGEEASQPARTKSPEAPAEPAATPTPTVPTLQLATLDGKPFDLATHRGRWVVVNFWATWCAPCLKEMPELSALDAMREHIEVVGLAYEEIEPEAMRAFLVEHPVAYPVAILDVYDPPKDFETPRGLPMTYLIAPDGKVAKRFLGPVTAKEIEAAIAAAGGPKVGA